MLNVILNVILAYVDYLLQITHSNTSKYSYINVVACVRTHGALAESEMEKKRIKNSSNSNNNTSCIGHSGSGAGGGLAVGTYARSHLAHAAKKQRKRNHCIDTREERLAFTIRCDGVWAFKYQNACISHRLLM